MNFYNSMQKQHNIYVELAKHKFVWGSCHTQVKPKEEWARLLTDHQQ